MADEEAERQRDRDQQAKIATLDATIRLAELGIRSLILVNGGAVIAVITFIGHMLASDVAGIQALANSLAPPLAFFAAGVCFSLFTVWLGYISQNTFHRRPFDADGEEARDATWLRRSAQGTAFMGLLHGLGRLPRGNRVDDAYPDHRRHHIAWGAPRSRLVCHSSVFCSNIRM